MPALCQKPVFENALRRRENHLNAVFANSDLAIDFARMTVHVVSFQIEAYREYS